MAAARLFLAALGISLAPCGGTGKGGSTPVPTITATATAPPAPAPSTPEQQMLSARRQALLDDYAKRLGKKDACVTWSGLNASQKGAFHTLTHRLFIARIHDGKDTPLLTLMTGLYSIRGKEAKRFFELPCGGFNANRIFLKMDPAAHAAMVASLAEPKDAMGLTEPMIRDFGVGAGLSESLIDRRWRLTNDTPHTPFQASLESEQGGPRAQTHFFKDAKPLEIDRGKDLDDVSDGFILEIDQDYDGVHSSEVTCKDFADKYAKKYNRPGFAQVDYAWAPRCDAPPVPMCCPPGSFMDGLTCTKCPPPPKPTTICTAPATSPLACSEAFCSGGDFSPGGNPFCQFDPNCFCCPPRGLGCQCARVDVEGPLTTCFDSFGRIAGLTTKGGQGSGCMTVPMVPCP